MLNSNFQRTAHLVRYYEIILYEYAVESIKMYISFSKMESKSKQKQKCRPHFICVSGSFECSEFDDLSVK